MFATCVHHNKPKKTQPKIIKKITFRDHSKVRCSFFVTLLYLSFFSSKNNLEFLHFCFCCLNFVSRSISTQIPFESKSKTKKYGFLSQYFFSFLAKNVKLLHARPKLLGEKCLFTFFSYPTFLIFQIITIVEQTLLLFQTFVFE